DDFHQAGTRPAGLLAHVGGRPLRRTLDRALRFFLQILRAELVSQLVDIPAQAVTGLPDLALDLFGVLSLVLTHDRCSFAHWTSFLMALTSSCVFSTVWWGGRTARLRRT